MLRRRVWRPSVCLLPYARRTVTTTTSASAFTCATTQTSLSCSVSVGGAFHASSVRYAPRGPRPAPPRPEPTQQQQQRNAPAASESEKKAEEQQQQQQRTKEDTTVTHSTFTSSLEGVDELPESPFDCMIDSVLPPQAHIGPQQGLPTTLRALVQLLIDPNASSVEDVPLSVFVAMMPRRQLAALGENKAWHEVVLASERYQGYKDARALRLAGVTSVGNWELQPDRVPLSAYSRGVLEKTYHTIMRQARRGPQQQQQSEVMAWLSKTIHKAILDEFASSNKTNTQLLLPLIGTLPRTEAMQAIAPVPSETAPQVVPNTTTTTNKNEAVQPQSSNVNEELVSREDDEDNTADDFERLMREDEERQRQHESNTATSPAAQKTTAQPQTVISKQEEATAKANEDNNEEEEEEEIVEEIVEEVEEEDDVVASKEADVTAAAANNTTTAVTSQANASLPEDTKGEDDSTLVHLAQLMLRQFNSADGYLHQTKKELRADEKNGYVIALDEDTAQVDPLALFSTFHTATPPSTSPIEVKALKEIWSSYNAHQLALEAAMERHEESAVDFHKEKSVEALVHGAVLLRAISREDVTTLKASSELPAFGFPLLSSDTRPYAQRRPRSSPHTDMNAKRVQDALAAYRSFFADKESRTMPFRPAIECNAGCGVVMLSGTTLHLYETSMKESVQEEQVRIHFAEAMLGVLHILREKIIPRVNTVHYHILVTKLNTNTNNSNGVEDMHGLMSATTIVSVDLTGPFTNAEKHRLRALAEPLGLAREVAEFGCVEDIVMELEESTRASVVHDLLQTREDLEALLTPTLAQLLPEDDEVTGLTEEQEDEPAAQPVHEEEEEDSAQHEGRARNNKSRRKEVKHNNEEEEEEVVKKAAAEDEVVEQEEDDWSEEVEEEETATRAASHRHKSQSAARNKEHHEDDDEDVGATRDEEEEEVTHTRRGGATLNASSSASRRAQPSTSTTTVTSSRARPTASATPSKHAFEYTAQGNKEDEEEEDTSKGPAQDDEDVEEEDEVVEEGEEEEVVEEDEEAAEEEQEEERNGTASARTQRDSNTSVRRHKGTTRHHSQADTHATTISNRAGNAYNEEHDDSIAEEEEEEGVTNAAQSHHEEVEDEDVVVRHVRGRKTATQSIPPRTARVPVPEDYYEDAEEEEQKSVQSRPVVPARRTVTQQQQVQQQQPALRTGSTTAAPPLRRATARQPSSPPATANDEYIEEEEVEEEEVHTPVPPPQPLRRSPVSPLRMVSSPNTTPVAMTTTSQTPVTVRRPVPRERLPASPSVTQTTTSVVRPGRNTQHTSTSTSGHSEDVVEHEAVYEEAAAQTQSSSSTTPQEQWFKRRPKKRYFS